MPTLYMIATPIGNLGDVTMRALEALRAVDVVVCEDTRHTVKLLNAFGIRKPLLSFHAHSPAAAAGKVLDLLAAGKDAAYASDAGTPNLSDPGAALVRAVRDAGYPVMPLPGASAATALISVCDFAGKSVLFEGFLSPKPGKRRRRLEELGGRGESFVLFESPYRIMKLLEAVAEVCPERPLLIGREMTKLHEEYLEGTAAELAGLLSERTTQKGEFTVLVGGRKKD